MSRDTEGMSPRHRAWCDVPDAQWNDWRWQLRNRVTTLEQLEQLIELEPAERRGIVGRQDFSFAVTPYYLSLIEGPNCPVRRQAIPVDAELVAAPGDLRDPLGEDDHSPVSILTHRYPDRALLYVTHNCPVYCRHCTRSRKVGDEASAPARADFDLAYDYLRRTPQVRDVLVSGGDPFSLSDARLGEIVGRLREIESIDVIRLCTRNPVTLPQRINETLVAALRPFGPLYVHTHFNHPRECTPEAARALAMLADAGFVLGNQMVLLRGVNDDADTVEALGRWLLRQRCRPYYMFQCDPVVGTGHLRTPVRVGLQILDQLRGRVSGLAIPQLALDLPRGGGKVTLVPDRGVSHEGDARVYRDAFGRHFTYIDVPDAPAPSE